jgi:sugar diacid utilization regulator
MSAIVDRPLRAVDGGGFRAALRAAGAVSAAAAGAVDAGELLAVVAASACAAVGVRRCSVHLRDENGRFSGRAAHPSSYLEAVREMSVGGPSDALAREIVETRTAVVASRSLKLRSVLGVPLLEDEQVVGLLFFDDAEARHPYTPVQVEIAATIGRLTGEALAQLRTTAHLRSELDTAARQNRLLRRVSMADGRLTQVVLDGGGLAGVVGVVAELTGKAAAFYDARMHRVAAADAPTGAGALHVRLLEDAGTAEQLLSLLHDTVAGSSTAVAPRLDAGVRHRHLVAPVDIGDQRCGWVVLMEHPSRLSAFDELTVRRAARHAAFELAAARRAASAAWDARSQLARQLIRGTQDDEVRRGAEYLGIELDVPRVVGFVTSACDSIDVEELVAALDRRMTGGVLATKGPEGVAILVDLPTGGPPLTAVRALKTMLAEACAEMGYDALAGLSAVCREHADVPRAYREAREVARCIDRFSSCAASRILAADDLGPVRLFVANGEPAAMDRFVADVLGPLLTGEDGTADLLRTLQSFFDAGRSIRLSAARLQVHENTVRYRLARVHALTGLDVANDASDQLSVQMSLLVLRLQGHPAMPSFDAPAEAGE